MGDVNQRYDPAFSVDNDLEVVEQSSDSAEIQGLVDSINIVDQANAGVSNDQIGIRNLPMDAMQGLTSTNRWKELTDIDHHNRLILALIKEKSM